MFVGTLMKLPVKARDSGVIATRSEQWRTTQRPARDHCMAPGRTATPSGHRYTRMFPDLPHLRIGPEVLQAMGRAGGACDSSHEARAEAIGVAAGWPVFGQFIAHDITADRSPVTHHDDEALLRNARSARLDLESVYGDGPIGNPFLFSRKDPAKMLLGLNDQDSADDLPRNQEGTALVGDPRQDVHLLISQMRHSYRVQRGGTDLTLFPDLIGFRPVASDRVIDWSLLFDIAGEPPAARARPIDGCLPEPLLRLPIDITGQLDDQDFESLAVRDLQRGVATGLPSGEAVAGLVGEEPLRPNEVGLREFGWSGETPLWYYLLKEAEVREGGERLGPVGSLIVGEVLLGIVDGDPESFRSVDPSWRPTLPSRVPDRFTLADLLVPQNQAP